ncbi:hypothetical protein [Vreelandella aquamarina]|uniref:hypothetical protein n=1 Tax=Vreelandella aquamarina TaxID=77097 RepID=UPI00384B45AA
MASIHSEQPVEDFLKAAIEQELLARGFDVGGDSPVIIQGDILELYSNLHLIDTFFYRQNSW